MRTSLLSLLVLSLAACSGGTVDDIVVDAGPDAHTGADGGGIDSGHPDLGTVPDSSTPVDSSIPVDSSVPVDASTPVDASSPLDGGSAPDSGTCSPLTADGTAIGTPCAAGSSTCPTGYTCFVMEGFVASYSCEIPCSADCQCPASTSCQVVTDKAGDHHLCQGT